MKKISFTDIVLAIIGAGTVAFIIAVLIIFARIGNEPSALIAGFFSFITAEAAICWQIYAKKHKIDIHTHTDAADILNGIDLIADPNEEDSGGEG